MRLLEGVEASAVLSPCGAYRYRLERTWDPRGTTVAFVMLNPSTADADVDDPTLRRCQEFARRWGHGRLVVANLYALRSPDPKALWKHPDPVGPENGWYLGGGLLGDLGAWPSMIVVAWGANARAVEVQRFQEILGTFRRSAYCLRTTLQGAPTHPLARGRHRIPDDVIPRPWPTP